MSWQRVAGCVLIFGAGGNDIETDFVHALSDHAAAKVQPMLGSDADAEIPEHHTLKKITPAKFLEHCEEMHAREQESGFRLNNR